MPGFFDLYENRPGRWRCLLAGIYGRAVRTHLFLHRRKWIEAKRLPAWVVSVGNLTVGGTGKTPMTAMIARALQEEGWRVAVVSRGYRGRSVEPVNVVSDGENVLLPPDQAGDEPVGMARQLSGVPVLTGRDRWLVGRQAIERFGTQAIVLDDGYQHLRLERDVNLLLLDARKPFGNGWLLPAGALREPESGLCRSSAIIFTRADMIDAESAGNLAARFPGRPVFFARHRAVGLKSLTGERRGGTGYLAGRRILAFCGLARPETFAESLVGLGAEVPYLVRWPDHHRPTGRDLELVLAKARELGTTDLVTTSKDAVKILGAGLERNLETLQTWVMEIEMELMDRGEDFKSLIRPKEKP